SLDIEVTTPDTGAEAAQPCHPGRADLRKDARVEIDELQAGSLDPCPHCLHQGCPLGRKRRTSRLDSRCRDDDREALGKPDGCEVAQECAQESFEFSRLAVAPQCKLIVQKRRSTAKGRPPLLRGCRCS